MKGFVTKLCDIDSIEIPKEMLEIRVEEQQVEEELQALSLRYAKEEPAEIAETGDTVFCKADAESYPDGRTILLYTGVALPGAEDAAKQVLGAHVGDTLTVQLAGKTVTLTVEKILRRTPVAVDDALIARLGMDGVATVADYRNYLRNKAAEDLKMEQSKAVIRYYLDQLDSASVTKAILYYVVLGLMSCVAMVGQVQAQAYSVKRARDTVWKKMLGMKMAYFDQNDPSDLMSAIINDSNKAVTDMVNAIVNLIPDIYYVVAALLRTNQYHWILSLSCFALLPLKYLYSFLMGRKVQAGTAKIYDEIGSLTSFLADRINHLPLIKTYTNEAEETENGNSVAHKLLRANMKLVHLDNISTGIVAVDFPATGDIRFQNVTFTYPGTDTPALSHVSFTIPRGSSAAIVGLCGSGKTTSVSLLERFYTPESGKIYIGNTDVEDIALAQFRKNFAYVQQGAEVFSGTLREALTYGIERDVTDEEILDAAEKTGFRTYLQLCGNCLDTPVASGGMSMSGGQSQRLVLTREVLRGGEIVLMDELTSALDVRVSAKIQDTMDTVFAGKTRILITHDLALRKSISEFWC